MAARLRAPGFYRAGLLMVVGVLFAAFLTWIVRMSNGHATFHHYLDANAILTVALLAAALEPKLFSEVVTRQGMSSFSYLIDHPVRYEDAADLFCLDLYQEFDINDLEATASGVQVLHRDSLGEAPNAPAQ